MKDEYADTIKRFIDLKIEADSILIQAHDLLETVVDEVVKRKHLPEMKDILEHLPPGSGWHKQKLREAIANIK